MRRLREKRGLRGGPVCQGVWFPQLKVMRAGDVDVGDCVVIGIDERALVRGSFAAYMMPILFMLGFALLGEAAMSGWLAAVELDLAGVLAGMAGLAVGLMWLKRHNRRIRDDRRYQPLILHKAADDVARCG